MTSMEMYSWTFNERVAPIATERRAIKRRVEWDSMVTIVNEMPTLRSNEMKDEWAEEGLSMEHLPVVAGR